jgi:short-subunit dehydrogenase
MERAHLAITHVVITGASSGIGAALARVYARPGVRLSLLARNLGRLEAVAAECRALGAICDLHAGDVTDQAAMQAWAEACEQRQPVDLVIANAGIGGDQVLAASGGETLAAASRIVATNLQGVLNTVIPLLPEFIARKHGSIVMISSLAGFIALPDAPVYSATKAAVRMYGHGLRRVLAPHGVKVTIASPGFIDTPMSASLSASLPFLWTADRAARHIARAVATGRRETVFPFGLALLVGLANILPVALLDRILIAQRNRHP